MHKQPDKPSFFEKLATAIVDRRNLIFFLYLCALIFSLFSQGWVKVCNDLTQYLPENTETRQGLTIMEDEFITYGTARIMLSNVTYDMAANLAAELASIDGVTSVSFGNGTEQDTPEEIAEYFKGSDALLSVTFDGEETDPISLSAMEEIKQRLAPYDASIDSTVGDSQAETLDQEMQVIFAVSVVIIVLVLGLTSHSFAEVPVLLLTFGAAALLNMGTNFLLGEISFVSDSVTVVLQLALAIDYAIILYHGTQCRHSRYFFQQSHNHFRLGRHDVYAVSYWLRYGTDPHQSHLFQSSFRLYTDAGPFDSFLQGNGENPAQKFCPLHRTLGALCGKSPLCQHPDLCRLLNPGILDVKSVSLRLRV